MQNAGSFERQWNGRKSLKGRFGGSVRGYWHEGNSLCYFIILVAMSASLRFGQAAESALLTIEALRGLHQVRPLEPKEEGLAARDLPAGVYGYAYSPGLDEVPVFAQKKYHSFEVHKATDGVEYLIGFVTPAEASNLELLTEGASIRLFPDPWENSQSLVRVAVSRMQVRTRVPPREEGNPFQFTIL